MKSIVPAGIANAVRTDSPRPPGAKIDGRLRAHREVDPVIRREAQQQADRWRNEEGNLIMVLHAIQNRHGFVPRAIAMELSRELGVKLARIYEVITFYHYFKLQPPGAHNITVCNGTACYLKGSSELLNACRSQLGIAEGQTTPDRQFRFEVVRCIGCCGMAPAMVVDGKTFGHVTPPEVGARISAIRAEKGAAS